MRKYLVAAAVVLVLAGAFYIVLAGGLFTNVVQTGAVQIQQQLDQGNKYLAEGEYDKAILTFQDVINVDAKNVPARVGIANAYIETDQIDAAQKVITEINNLGWQSVPVSDVIKLADAYLAHNQPELAWELLNLVNNILPDQSLLNKAEAVGRSIAGTWQVEYSFLSEGRSMSVEAVGGHNSGTFTTSEGGSGNYSVDGDNISGSYQNPEFSATYQGVFSSDISISGSGQSNLNIPGQWSAQKILKRVEN